jgi:8-oxo-dGTP pyrophosphatase MutT (NUDIX family)
VLAQAGAIPYRFGPGGTLQVLLIRRRHKRRWGIPKGIVEPHQTVREAALQETIEEAGIAGELSDQPIGEFEYTKWGWLCRVAVFLLNVTREHEHYEEQAFRERRWFDLADALGCRTRQGIQPLLREAERDLRRKA